MNEREQFIAEKHKEVDNILAPVVDAKDIVPIKMAIEQANSPEISQSELYDKYYGEDGRPAHAKSALVKGQVTRVISRYPDIFKPLRDSQVINMEGILKNLNDEALNPDNKLGDRLRASKLVLDTAIQVEKMVKDKQITNISIDSVAIDGKSFGEIIAETRGRVLDQGREK